MPELPEVENIVRSLQPHVAGLRITRVEYLRTDIITSRNGLAPEKLAGQTFKDVRRLGKNLVFETREGYSILVNLGMTGRFDWVDADAPLPAHTHVRFHLDSRPPKELRYNDIRRFGYLEISKIRQLDSSAHLERLGPDALVISVEELAQRLAGTRRAIKSALLDQNRVAGIGNIYADEALFGAGLHPERPANGLNRNEVSALKESIVKVLEAAIAQGGSSIRDYKNALGESGRFQEQHCVYGREGEKCICCNSMIERIVICGRSSHYCPKCQQPKRKERRTQGSKKTKGKYQSNERK